MEFSIGCLGLSMIWQLVSPRVNELRDRVTEKRKERKRERKIIVFCYPILDDMPSAVCYLLHRHYWYGEGYYTRVWIPGGGDYWGPFWRLPTTESRSVLW